MVQGKLREARKLLNSLTAEQRASMEAAQERTDAAAGSSDTPASYNGPASGRGRTAVEFAYAQLGKPYEWGSERQDHPRAPHREEHRDRPPLGSMPFFAACRP
ncbi:hypothetical protein OG806_48245 [Streptomyces sp. NBC_00882]|uniref:hypothetical protein n=1 Tax=Streptomyces TaxID=1883 RepID=UPI00386DE026|nr:hypothetical protein OG806_48245 [Streptomyces sp. NBC_00882]WSZ63572.1 hypothetical protein OH824_47085 [Streptomyces canus]